MKRKCLLDMLTARQVARMCGIRATKGNLEEVRLWLRDMRRDKAQWIFFLPTDRDVWWWVYRQLAWQFLCAVEYESMAFDKIPNPRTHGHSKNHLDKQRKQT